MKFEDMQINSDGLKKIIDFLDSEKNILATSSTTKYKVFELEKATSLEAPPQNYNVTIVSAYSPIPKKTFDDLSNLLGESQIR